MSSSLDMSLDDIIKSNKTSSSSSRGRSRPSGAGPARRFPNRSGQRSAPYPAAKAPESSWRHDMYADAADAFPGSDHPRISSIETGTKLYISNLDYGVSNEDIMELFSEMGDIKRYSVHYDRSGRSKGTAEVVFTRRVDAFTALKRYNNVQLDGKPMNIKVIERLAVLPHLANVGTGSANVVSKSVLGKTGSTGGARAGGRGRRRRPVEGKARKEPLSADALDADLDKYHSEAMQTN